MQHPQIFALKSKVIYVLELRSKKHGGNNPCLKKQMLQP